MAQGDFGVVPNVWRPQFVPPINSGEDTQVGITGNAADNLGATSTTIQESFFNVPFVGWQKVGDRGPFTITANAFTDVVSFTFDTRTPSHLLVVSFKDPPAAFGNTSFRWLDTNAAFGAIDPATAGTANGVGLYVVRIDSMINMSLLGLSPAFHHSAQVTAFYCHSMTASSLSIGTPNTVISGGNGATVLSGDFTDTSFPMTLQAKMVAAATSTTLVRVSYFKLGNQLAADTT